MKWDQVGQVGHGISTALKNISEARIYKPKKFYKLYLISSDFFYKTTLLTYYLAYDAYIIFATLDCMYDVRIFLKQGYINQKSFINCTSYQVTSFTKLPFLPITLLMMPI